MQRSSDSLYYRLRHEVAIELSLQRLPTTSVDKSGEAKPSYEFIPSLHYKNNSLSSPFLKDLLHLPLPKEVLKVMEKNKDINKAQQTPTPSSKKTAERRKKKDTSKTASTSARKKRKTNEKSAGRIGQTEVTKHVEKVIDKSKSKHKSIKKEVNKNSKHEKGEVPPAYSPQQFIGLYICKEHNGVKNLGTVLSYDPKTKLFKILFDNDKTNDMELDELLKSKATAKDIFEARQALQSRHLRAFPMESA
ncbi:hypothetical protein Fmac_016073 [Flemingia macrophylla]|uniref:Uncharacterized protein n=1 Tax=Flemingia macrophylla TaxID=520843 RepID=A0ABD1MGC5_9FABA